MTTLLAKNLTGIDAWRAFFNTNHRDYEIADSNYQIQLFADGDATWMLISQYTSDITATDYTFMPVDDADLLIAKQHIFSFLKTVNFDFLQLIAWLENATFIETEIAEEITVGKLRITRNYARASASPVQELRKLGESNQLVHDVAEYKRTEQT